MPSDLVVELFLLFWPFTGLTHLFSHSFRSRKHWSGRGHHRYAIVHLFLPAPQERWDSRYFLIGSAMKCPNLRTQSSDTTIWLWCLWDLRLIIIIIIILIKQAYWDLTLRPDTGYVVNVCIRSRRAPVPQLPRPSGWNNEKRLSQVYSIKVISLIDRNRLSKSPAW